MKITTTLLLVLFCSLYSFSTDYYVNDASSSGDVYCTSSGSSGYDGLTPATPINSLTLLLSTYGGVLSPGDRIFIDAGDYDDVNLTLSYNGISIIGAGALLTQFDNDHASSDSNQLFEITGDDITIEGIFVGGYNNGADASAIYINGSQNLTINNVLVDENLPGGGSSAIIITGGAEVTFNGGGSNCNSPLPSVAGGGINVEGNNNTVIINNYTFARNSKSFEAGSGLYVKGTDGTTVVTVNNSNFSENWNGTSQGGAAAALVGATLNINGTCFSANETDYGSDPSYGGAISVGRGAVLNVDNCEFNGNSNTSGSGRGGAIALYTTSAYGGSGGSTVNISNSSFNGNSATDDGNHIYCRESTPSAVININNCSFSATGDDIYRYSGTINQQFSGNTSTRGTYTPLNLIDPTGTPITNCPVLQGTCYGIILPTELIAFNANCSGESIDVLFEIGSELNNDYFILEYAKSDFVFEPLQTINSAGDHQNTLEYKTSLRIPNGMAYLKLSQKDKDGRKTLLKVIPIFNCENNNIITYNSERIQITGEQLKGEYNLEIIDLSGRLIFQVDDYNPNNEEIEINNIQLPVKGIYLVHFKNAQVEFTQRISSL